MSWCLFVAFAGGERAQLVCYVLAKLSHHDTYMTVCVCFCCRCCCCALFVSRIIIGGEGGGGGLHCDMVGGVGKGLSREYLCVWRVCLCVFVSVVLFVCLFVCIMWFCELTMIDTYHAATFFFSGPRWWPFF